MGNGGFEGVAKDACLIAIDVCLIMLSASDAQVPKVLIARDVVFRICWVHVFVGVLGDREGRLKLVDR